MGYPTDQDFKAAKRGPWPPSFHYRTEVLRTCPNFDKDDEQTKLSLAGLGVAGEAGEVADLIKKFLHHGKPIDRDKLIKEMGDVYWYLEYLGATIGVSTEDVMRANAAKTRARFPNGFSHEAANARADEAQPSKGRSDGK
jgi:NTP pyrophosphatase (non-canonical NTP hydrolase)